jgi:Amt family ammonium transporter
VLDTGDTAWMLIATALVLFMTPGLAFFYGGMVRSKNVLGMLMQNFFAMGLIGVLWVMVGFTIAFGNTGDHGWLGNFDFIGMKNTVNQLAPLAPTIPLVLFAAYQMTFAIITPALITGATADRLKFGSYVVFIGAWLLIVYAPVAHWIFGGGWIAHMGALDYAGGAVVHINAGAAALAVVLIIGRRRGYPDEPMPPHSLPWTLIGTGILWFGWAGFNAGSALGANFQAAQAILNSFVAASAAMIGWLIVETIKDGKATTLGAASGAVAGLVAITPCAGFVETMPAVIIGLVAGAVCFTALGIKRRYKFDDSLDVVAVHLCGGLIGTMLLGLFASATVNPLVVNEGLFNGGGFTLLGYQAVAAGFTLVYSFVLSFAIAKIIQRIMGLRIDEAAEQEGMDLSQHAETAYA